MKKIFLIMSILLCTKSFAQDNLQYKDATSMMAMQQKFCSVQRSIGELANNKLLNQIEVDEINKLFKQYDAFKVKYKSNEMNSYAWSSEEQCMNSGKDNVKKTQDMYLKSFESEKIRNKTDRSDGEAPLIYIRQCKFTKKAGDIDWNASWTEEVNRDINESMRILKTNLYYLEWRLSKKASAGTLFWTNKLISEVEGNPAQCYEPIQDEKGWRLELRKLAVIEVVELVEEKKRVAPFSKSGKEIHESMCRLLEDPRIPSPQGVQCVFNYK